MPREIVGIRIYTYRLGGDYTISHHPANVIDLINRMTSNDSAFLLHDDFEQDPIFLGYCENIDTARAYLRSGTNNSISDSLYTAVIENLQDILYTVEVEPDPENPDHSYHDYNTRFDNINAELVPVVFRYFVHLELSEESYIPDLIRGGITGFAEGVYLKNKTLFGTVEGIFFDDVLDHKDRIYEFYFGCYGVSPEATSQVLNIEYMTSAGIGSVSIDVTDQLVGQPKGGVIICKNVTLPNLEDPNQVFTVSFETDNPNYEVQLVFGYNFYQSNKLEFQVNYGDSFYNAIEAETGIQIAVVPKISSQLIGDEEGTDYAKEWRCFDKDGNELLLWDNYEQTSSGLSRLVSDSTIHIYKDHRFVAYCV